MEDFYKVLSISPKAGSYRIAIAYKNLITGMVESSQTAFDDEAFIEINRAYFVLGNEQGRKFYDILYKCLIENTWQLNDSIVAKYTDVVEYLAEDGVKKAKLWFENMKSLKDSDLVNSFTLLFMVEGLFQQNGGSLGLTGAAGILYSVCCLGTLLNTVMDFSPEIFVLTIIFGFLGPTITTIRYREYVVSKVEKETGLLANI